eukprot:11498861-Prorocentrum_lima.AAC.1
MEVRIPEEEGTTCKRCTENWRELFSFERTHGWEQAQMEYERWRWLPKGYPHLWCSECDERRCLGCAR